MDRRKINLGVEPEIFYLDFKDSGRRIDIDLVLEENESVKKHWFFGTKKLTIPNNFNRIKFKAFFWTNRKELEIENAYSIKEINGFIKTIVEFLKTLYGEINIIKFNYVIETKTGEIILESLKRPSPEMFLLSELDSGKVPILTTIIELGFSEIIISMSGSTIRSIEGKKGAGTSIKITQ